MEGEDHTFEHHIRLEPNVLSHLDNIVAEYSEGKSLKLAAINPNDWDFTKDPKIPLGITSGAPKAISNPVAQTVETSGAGKTQVSLHVNKDQEIRPPQLAESVNEQQSDSETSAYSAAQPSEHRFSVSYRSGPWSHYSKWRALIERVYGKKTDEAVEFRHSGVYKRVAVKEPKSLTTLGRQEVSTNIAVQVFSAYDVLLLRCAHIHYRNLPDLTSHFDVVKLSFVLLKLESTPGFKYSEYIKARWVKQVRERRLDVLLKMIGELLIRDEDLTHGGIEEFHDEQSIGTAFESMRQKFPDLISFIRVISYMQKYGPESVEPIPEIMIYDDKLKWFINSIGKGSNTPAVVEFLLEPFKLNRRLIQDHERVTQAPIHVPAQSPSKRKLSSDYHQEKEESMKISRLRDKTYDVDVTDVVPNLMTRKGRVIIPTVEEKPRQEDAQLGKIKSSISGKMNIPDPDVIMDSGKDDLMSTIVSIVEDVLSIKLQPIVSKLEVLERRFDRAMADFEVYRQSVTTVFAAKGAKDLGDTARFNRSLLAGKSKGEVEGSHQSMAEGQDVPDELKSLLGSSDEERTLMGVVMKFAEEGGITRDNVEEAIEVLGDFFKSRDREGYVKMLTREKLLSRTYHARLKPVILHCLNSG